MININLIAERRARRIREMMILRISMLSVVCLIVLMVLWNIATWLYGFSAQNDVKSMRDRIASQQPRYEEWQRVQEEIVTRQPIVSLLEQVQKSEGAWMTILGDMSIITPNEVVLDSLNTTTEGKDVKLRIAGRALDQKTVAKFMEAFNQQTSWAGKATLRTLTAESKSDATGKTLEQQNVHFELIVPVNGMVGGDL